MATHLQNQCNRIMLMMITTVSLIKLR